MDRLGNSFIIALGTLILTLAVAVPASYAVARFRDGVSTSMMVLLTAVQLLPAIATSIPLFVMFRQMGLINTHLSIILADLSVTLPFAVILLRPYFKQFPYEVEEAAKLDGLGVASDDRQNHHSDDPAGSRDDRLLRIPHGGRIHLRAHAVHAAGGPTLTVALNRLIGQYGTNWNHLMAVAALIATPVLLIFIALQRYIVAGLAGGATKG